MHVVVIGGGVVGLSSAYYLHKAGFEVTVLEKNGQLGAEASAANVNQLSYSSIFSPISPAVLCDIPKFLFGRDSVIRFEKLYDLKLLKWIWQAMPSLLSRRIYERIAVAAMEVNAQSKVLMDAFVAAHPEIDFDYQVCGRLQLYKTRREAEALYAAYQRLGFDGSIEVLDADGILAVEPSLAGRMGGVEAGVFFEDDAVGDCQAFTQGLAVYLAAQGVEIKTGVEVFDVDVADGKVQRLKTSGGDVEADVYVMAAGYQARGLLKSACVSMPIYPVKGYTYEIPAAGAFKTSVIDASSKMVFTPLSGRCKVSSGVFFGESEAHHDAFLSKLKDNARRFYPDLDFSDATVRTGYRPWVPNSLPVVKRSEYSNLYLNAGHGMLGWTMSQSTAKDLADLVVEGRE